MAQVFTFFPGNGPAFSVESAIRAFEPSRPYPQNPQVIVYRTRFMQLRAYYTKPTPLTPHPDLPQVYFADDIDFQDRPGGLVEWTRVYTTLPTSWNDFSSDAYNYPGYQGTLAVLGRNPFTHIVTTKVVHDYYAVGAFTAFANNIANYDNLNASPWIKSAVATTGNVGTIPACAGGGNYAAQIQSDGSAAQHYITQVAGGSGVYPGAIFVKRRDANVARVAMVSNVSPNFTLTYAAVNITTGQVIDSVNCSPNVAAIGDGWWRIRLDGAVGNFTNVALGLAVCASNGALTHSEDIGLYAWRATVDAVGGTVPYATVPPTVAGDGTTNYPINVADQIPFKFGTRFLYQAPWGVGASNAVATQFVSEYLSDGGFGIIATSPTLTNYKANVTTDSGNTNSYSIEAQDSVQSLWYGTIWERQRKYVKAI